MGFSDANIHQDETLKSEMAVAYMGVSCLTTDLKELDRMQWGGQDWAQMAVYSRNAVQSVLMAAIDSTLFSSADAFMSYVDSRLDTFLESYAGKRISEKVHSARNSLRAAKELASRGSGYNYQYAHSMIEMAEAWLGNIDF